MRLALVCFYCLCVFVYVLYFIATMSFAGYFLPVLFCMLSMLISDSRFDLVWFRLSCDHGWIRSGSVNVRKQQQNNNNNCKENMTVGWLLASIASVWVLLYTVHHFFFTSSDRRLARCHKGIRAKSYNPPFFREFPQYWGIVVSRSLGSCHCTVAGEYHGSFVDDFVSDCLFRLGQRRENLSSGTGTIPKSSLQYVTQMRNQQEKWASFSLYLNRFHTININILAL